MTAMMIAMMTATAKMHWVGGRLRAVVIHTAHLQPWVSIDDEWKVIGGGIMHLHLTRLSVADAATEQ